MQLPAIACLSHGMRVASQPSMKTSAVLATFTVLLLATPSEARANREYRTSKGFGLGIMLGAPTGLSGKYNFDRSNVALDFGIGSSDHLHHHDHGLEIHADILWHPVALTRNRTFAMPLYLGVGVGYYDHDHDHDHDHMTDGSVAARIPFGLALDFRRAPLDIFFELVPVVGVYRHHDHRGVDLTGAAGIRYYF